MSTPPNDTPSNPGGPQWGDPAEQAGNDAAANPYQQHSGSKFGTQAYDPNAYGGPVGEPDKFRKLKLFTLISLGVYMVNQLVGLIMFGSEDFRDETIAELQQTYADAGMTLEASEIDGIISAGLVFYAVFALIFLGLYLLVYFGLRADKNWARILGIVFAIIGSVFGLAGFAISGFSDILTVIVTLVWIAVNIFWLVLAFNADVAQYLQSKKAI